LLRNDHAQHNNSLQFTDVTKQVAPKLANIGMVTSAIWTDFNNDNKVDLILTGEFMPLCFFKNDGKQLKDVTKYTGLENFSGWWNSIAAGDFDNDGDIDYVAGNLGLNSRHKATPKEPLCIYAKDYDKNGLIDPVMCYYVNGKNYVYPSRDEMIKQMNPMRRRFASYSDFAKVTFEESFLPAEISEAYVVKSECFESSYIENKGNGKFVRKALPVEAQFAPVFGLLTGDYNEDGNLDVLVAGNSYSTEASTGRYDAMSGLILIGDGKGNFHSAKSSVTGFTANGDVKSLAIIRGQKGGNIILTGNNSGKMEAHQKQGVDHNIPIKYNDAYAIVYKKDGQHYKQLSLSIFP
jgi:hypothetical protein